MARVYASAAMVSILNGISFCIFFSCHGMVGVLTPAQPNHDSDFDWMEAATRELFPEVQAPAAPMQRGAQGQNSNAPELPRAALLSVIALVAVSGVVQEE